MILVTGATGRLGSRVVRALRRRGHEVRSLVRKGSAYFWLNDTGCDYFFGDLRDPESLARAARGVSAVVATAAVRRERTENHHGNVTSGGNVALVDAALAAGATRFVLVSCAAVSSPDAERAPLLTAKLAAERHLLASSLNATVVRPGLFAANYADLLRRTEHNGATFLPGRAEATVAPVHVDDVAEACATAVLRDDLAGQVLTLHGPERMANREALLRGARACGMPETHWALPPSALRAMATLTRPLGRRWTHQLHALDALFSMDAEREGGGAAEVLGLRLTPYDEAVRASFIDRHPDEDPDARETKVIHRQFNATVYAPGAVKWADLPDGPPSRKD